jgi:peptidyl-prolyl cis-trans isomerase C
VAQINDEVIYEDEFERELTIYMGRMKAQGAQVTGPFESQMRTQLLDELVNRSLLSQASHAKGINADPARVDQEIDAIKKRFPNQQQFETTLANMNLTESSLKAQIAQQMEIRELVDKEISSKIDITEKETRAYYDGNTAQFKRPEEVHARHILIKVDPKSDDQTKAEARKKIEGIKKRADSGEDFAELAKETSEGPSAPNGGDLGFFTRGRMVPPFEKAAFALEKGQISDIVETRFGYHVIMVVDRQEEKLLSYEEVKTKLAAKLRNDQIQDRVRTYIEGLRKTAKIETFLE